VNAPYEVLSAMQYGLNKVFTGETDALLEASMVSAAKRSLHSADVSPVVLQAGAAFWKHREPHSALPSHLLMGGAEGKNYFATAWQAFIANQEKPLLERTLAHARASPMTGVSLGATPLALSTHTLEAWQTKAKADSSRADEAFSLPGSERDVTQKIVMVPLSGMLQYRPGMFAMYFGASSLELFAERMRLYANDDTVVKIIILADSGGGEVLGISNAVEAVRYARSKKPVIAYGETQACSAAYWIASQAERIVASGASQFGSIGILAPMIDDTKNLADQGVTFTWVRSGESKALGQQGEPITNEQETELQRIVNEHFDVFVSDVAAGRKQTEAQVRKAYGDGKIYGSNKSLELGLIDEISTLETLLEREAV
jgi:signal peptide peptidase SppA